MLVRRWLMCGLLMCALLFLSPALAQAQFVPNQLKLVVILTRHGVRSPLSSAADYARSPWPDIQKDWHVECCGDLTPRGSALVTLLGRYYRSYYAKKRLLPESGCPAQQVYIWADNEERTIGTAKALSKGLSEGSAGCDVAVNSLPYQSQPCDQSKDAKSCQRGKGGPTDLWFHPLAKLGPPDPIKIKQIVDGINNRYDQLFATYLPQLQALQKTLGCCDASKCPNAPCTLLSLPHQATIDGGTVKWEGPFAVGSTAAEIFLLEYGNGMPCKDVGWGRVAFRSPDCIGPESFRKMQEIHTAYFQQLQRNPYLAKIQGSNLTNQVLKAVQQSVKSPDATRLIIFSGHDTNVANVAAMLGLSWKLPDLPENDTPPAGALVFELYAGKNAGDYFVKVRYVHQTLLQLRTQAVLSPAHPPNWVELSLPGCGEHCPFRSFEKTLQGAIDPKFVTQKPAGD